MWGYSVLYKFISLTMPHAIEYWLSSFLWHKHAITNEYCILDMRLGPSSIKAITTHLLVKLQLMLKYPSFFCSIIDLFCVILAMTTAFYVTVTMVLRVGLSALTSHSANICHNGTRNHTITNTIMYLPL